MAIIKCKMCGGDLELVPGETIAQCEYCDTRQTVPTADNEKKLNLFNRANRLRFGCEFDKAASVYESIVAEFPAEAEAYWGLVLCEYGIEYVDDPATGNKVPTCHRSSFDSVMDDSNLEQALEHADTVARGQYLAEAKQLEELRKDIIEVSGKEPPYDIFICYKETAPDGQRTEDSVLAQDVYDALTARGYRVFFSRITLEDKLGRQYEPYIFAALNSARVMLAFGTAFEYFDAVWVKNEWGRYLKIMAKDKTRHLIPCYKGIDAYDMPKEFTKLQAQDLGKVGAVQDLLRGIEKLIPRQEKQPEAPAAPVFKRVERRSDLDNGDTYMNLKDYDQAFEFYAAAVRSDASDYRGWWGQIAAKTEDFTQSDSEFSKDVWNWFTYVRKLAPTEELTTMQARYDRFINDFITTGNNHLSKKDYTNSQQCYLLVSHMVPEDYRGYWGQIVAKTKGLTENRCGDQEIERWYAEVKRLAPADKFPAIKKQFSNYLMNISNGLAEITVQKARERQVSGTKRAQELRAIPKDKPDGIGGTLLARIGLIALWGALSAWFGYRCENVNDMFLGLEGLVTVVNRVLMIDCIACLVYVLVRTVMILVRCGKTQQTQKQNAEAKKKHELELAAKHQRAVFLCGQLINLGVSVISPYYYNQAGQPYGLQIPEDPQVKTLLKQVDEKIE